LKYPFGIIAVTIMLPALGIVIWKITTKPVSISEIVVAETPSKPTAVNGDSHFQTVRAGSRVITPEDFQWELELHTQTSALDAAADDAASEKSKAPASPAVKSLGANGESADLRERIMTSVIERKILYQFIETPSFSFDLSNPALFTKCLEALKESIAAAPAFFATKQSQERLKAKLCEQSVIDQYLDQQVFPSIRMDPSDISSYYRTHEKEFKRPFRIIVRQVVLADEAKAHEVRKEIKRSNFALLAQQYSITPDASKGGLVGPFSKEQLPTLFDSVYTMPIGEITGVIRSDYGFHIIMPIESLPAETLSLSVATPIIREEILRTKKLSVYQNFLHRAMNAVPVTSPNSGVYQ
jgi:parvulin-like peptidyl-prolyl isomerase